MKAWIVGMLIGLGFGVLSVALFLTLPGHNIFSTFLAFVNMPAALPAMMIILPFDLSYSMETKLLYAANILINGIYGAGIGFLYSKLKRKRTNHQ